MTTHLPATTTDRANSTAPGVIEGSGALIFNADDWGRDEETTKRTLMCLDRGTLSSVSAMVFMQHSEGAAAAALDRGIDVGLHLNFTTPFSGRSCRAGLAERQREISAFVRRHAIARAMYHPGLSQSFEFAVAAQIEEFNRLYGRPPNRIDGHHHMHLCANIMVPGLLPRGSIVRRHFSLEHGEKLIRNRFFSIYTDILLAHRYRAVDHLFPLRPLEVVRLHRIFSLSRQYVVEIETHPVETEEFCFLAGNDRIFHWLGDFRIAPCFSLFTRQ